MTTAADALARRRIARAADALRDAEVLVADQRWRGAINRLTRAFDKRQLTDYADLSDPGAEDVQEIDRGVRPLVQFCERFVAEHVGESERDAP